PARPAPALRLRGSLSALSQQQQLLDVVIPRRGNGRFDQHLPDGMDRLADFNLITFKSHREAPDDWSLSVPASLRAIPCGAPGAAVCSPCRRRRHTPESTPCPQTSRAGQAPSSSAFRKTAAATKTGNAGGPTCPSASGAPSARTTAAAATPGPTCR